MFNTINVQDIHTYKQYKILKISRFFNDFIDGYIESNIKSKNILWVSLDKDNIINGLLIYDMIESVGTIFTESYEAFNALYEKVPSNGNVFSEIYIQNIKHEVYHIYSLNLKNYNNMTLSTQVKILKSDEIQRAIDLYSITYKKINENAMLNMFYNGDRCFVVEFNGNIAGVGWASLSNNNGRLHSLLVMPNYRHMGIGKSLTYARLNWLKMKHVNMAISEISEYNLHSQRIAISVGMNVIGNIMLYKKQ
ncbi:MAG: GNAT family N-acetyltransferase [Thermoplasmata archaeon]